MKIGSGRITFLKEKQNICFAWFSSPGQVKHCVKKTFVKGIRFSDKWRSNVLPIHFPQITRHMVFYKLKFKIFWVFHVVLFKRLFGGKIIRSGQT